MKVKRISKRESELMMFLIKGYKLGAIAKELNINQKTASTYYARIKKKLELTSGANAYLVVRTYLLKYGKLDRAELHSAYYMYGNKGACWTDNIHIAKSGQSTTLCGTYMLASNWARIWEHQSIGCPDCINKYKREIKIPKQ